MILRRPLTTAPAPEPEAEAGAAAEDEAGALHAEVLGDEAAAAAGDHVVDCDCQACPA